MIDIFDKETLITMLKTSNLQFFSSGTLYVNDPFFITRWNIKDTILKSTISYSKLNQETFTLDMSDDRIPSGWNLFGFNQSFSRLDELNAPYHRNNHLELHYVSKGEFKLKVNQTIVTLKKGDVCLINPHCYHSDIILASEDELELYILGFNESSIEHYQKVMKEYPVFDKAFIKGNNISEYLIIRDIDLEEKVKALENNIGNIKETDLFALISYLYKFEHEIFVEDATSRNTMLFEEIDNFIHRNFKTVSLEDLEFIFNFSKDHISRIIKKETGFTFNKYLQNIKINKAKDLLKNTNLPIKDIIQKVGYQNESYFYRLFRKNVGANPNEYRKSD